MAKKKLVVAGAVGVIGRTVIAHFDTLDDWSVVGLSRSKPDFPMKAEHVSVDLLDAAASLKTLGGIKGATHAVFAALQWTPDLAAQVAPNRELVVNLIKGLEAGSGDTLRHVTLMQGGKAYGCHLGPFRTPAKESDPRHMPPNFYYAQEDFLREASVGKAWSWTAIRPEAVIGPAVGNPFNLLMVIAVYALISKSLGLPLVFPGTRQNYEVLYQYTDARILARSTEWAAETPECAGEIFNITNGDYFRWERMFETVAKFFDMPLGYPQPFELTTMMADKAPIWDALVKRHGLKPYAYDKIAAWHFGDFIFKTPYDNITSTIKARKFGFQDCLDSEDTMIQQLTELQRLGILPADMTSVGKL
ncbi:SDR family oxidoreductase [Pseudoxanthobacter sp. M-2]|uniref:SDR family oxidoreductase n=1 Tax=Pseudoxanthobacter sp. M-2 TaxID=3078754 RepID=UPI0038FCDE83